MKEEDFEISIKVLVVGNGGVGKSSLIRRFCKDTLTDQYKKTIGVDFLEKQQFVPTIGETVTMMVWDTAGQEEFDVITKNYYRANDICLPGAPARRVVAQEILDKRPVEGYTDLEDFVAHVPRLHPYKDKLKRKLRFEDPPNKHAKIDAEDGMEDEFEVEKIVGHRKNEGGGLEYLIRWKGYQPSADIWESESNTASCRIEHH